MNYRNADLNLLKVFEALMNEGNVTRAASKLSLTQPTVSNALRRLRETYGDPLFVRNGAGIRATRRATELWAPLSRSLRTIRGTLEGESFDASQSDARVTVSMTDYVACIVAPRLLERLGELAPGMRLHTHPGTVVDFGQSLDDNRADFAIGAYNDDVQRPGFMRSRRLWTVDFACFMRSDHPLAKLDKIPLKKFLNARHLDVSLAGRIGGIYDRVLQSRGLQRNLVTTVSHYAVAYEAVRRSDLIAVLPWSEGLETMRMTGLKRVAPPLAAPARTVELEWHERHETSALHQWFIALVVEMLARDPLPRVARARS
ncbi:LysR family transcriptional regulator [Variovorax guangxiensis]|uniref:LysR family transcriptional regulator n=1 Tax=Variovorax guangxiensis TaxID=1775474 RepID=UPI0028625973|nr:LysR family transcriptional regulator [Variovorax guangxiensis]MDR6860446.1 DNA-binding transcriptional LysR family regulator [Variovorax guangxiensis]